ncbi:MULTISPECIES: type II toxin-antitoxin system PemK/MazF family toxin [unclassified Staphylococcus]|uniref:type II toxin-antitoxin system PemK/MazF family toxin n=1 Tax=unclassified Staphylococcus TaxID=91994 RepID=UPI0021CF37B4|nr:MULTISPECIES: type II toxin-antitoxin system PemK/MazF family toxin [unclassified Staphylococcus]UXR79014.1 type II toxin-antitoxin system PemK/MazF family toxin [Staphylococcus sp. IVB6227]UXR83174.1 type II toxin-antitoxin system PemK/MazF family toxin [Staphylococcus sp. IVB6214]
MKREKAHEIIDETNIKYKKIFDSNKEKYTSLPYWLRSHSNILYKEITGEIRPNYNLFKRGTIVYVDFGVNIGSEISGGHFAIVLNHSDSKKSSTINVVPLSSKNKKHYLPIDKTVFDNAANTLLESEKSLYKKEQEIDGLKSTIESLLIDIEKKQAKIDETIHLNEKISNEKELENTIIEMNIFGKTVDELENFVEKHDKLINEIKKDREDISKVFAKYSKYNKQTFVCYKAIQNISKLRVRKINKFDPSGTIKVDNNTLDKLDTKIIEEYTNKKVD